MKKSHTFGKVIAAILIVCLTLAALATIGVSIWTISKKSPREKTVLEADSYRNYADEIFLNTKDYPELSDLGLRLITGYDTSYRRGNETKADTAEAIRRHFDPNKGILVIVHGVNAGYGRDGTGNMRSDSRVAEINKYGRETEADYFKQDPNSLQTYDLAKYWHDGDYNVFYFHWENFSDYYSGNSSFDVLNTPNHVQERIWSTDTGVQAVYRRDGQPAQTEPGTALNGSVAEWFVGEYIRMVRAVEEVYPEYAAKDKDIRVAGHSMGGVLTDAGVTLLKLVAEKGQVDMEMTPNRIAMLDSFIALVGGNYNLAWTGKPYAKGIDGNYLLALQLLVEVFDVAVEYYTNEGFTVPFLNINGLTDFVFSEEDGVFHGAMSERANRVLKYCPIIELSPYFVGVKNPIFTNGHNPVREWYFTSILYDAPKTSDGVTVPTARMSDEDIKALRGKFFEMKNAQESDCETVRCDDDTFILH